MGASSSEEGAVLCFEECDRLMTIRPGERDDVTVLERVRVFRGLRELQSKQP